MTESNVATNVLYCGDCKGVLKKSDESIDLVYIDPPFFSQKEYENFWIKDKVTTLKFSDKDWEEIARIKDKDGLEIQLKTVKEILSEE
jgi:site-specific DNA-adenine methylase